MGHCNSIDQKRLLSVNVADHIWLVCNLIGQIEKILLQVSQPFPNRGKPMNAYHFVISLLFVKWLREDKLRILKSNSTTLQLVKS